MEKIVDIKNVSKSYKTKYGISEVLFDIDLEVLPGEFVMISGKSGCGKSTLLNILGLMDDITGGSYILDGSDVTKMSVSEKSRIRNEKIGFIFQSYNLINNMTALENVEIPMGYRGIEKKERRERAAELLSSVGLAEKSRNFPLSMSGGEQQRAAIARAISNKPVLLLADEPTGNLDEENVAVVMELLRKLNQSGTTIIMVTHDAELLAYGSRIVNMSKGRIVL